MRRTKKAPTSQTQPRSHYGDTKKVKQNTASNVWQCKESSKFGCQVLKPILSKHQKKSSGPFLEKVTGPSTKRTARLPSPRFDRVRREPICFQIRRLAGAVQRLVHELRHLRLTVAPASVARNEKRELQRAHRKRKKKEKGETGSAEMKKRRCPWGPLRSAATKKS